MSNLITCFLETFLFSRQKRRAADVDPDAPLELAAVMMDGEISEAELDLAASVMRKLQSFVSELPTNQHVDARRRMAFVHRGVERYLAGESFLCLHWQVWPSIVVLTAPSSIVSPANCSFTSAPALWATKALLSASRWTAFTALARK